MKLVHKELLLFFSTNFAFTVNFELYLFLPSDTKDTSSFFPCFYVSKSQTAVK